MSLDNYTPHRSTQAAPFPASTAVEIGDLLWWDNTAKVARRASARSDTGSAAGNQADFRPLFLGVAADQRLAGETSTGAASHRRVILEGAFICDCDPATFEYGDLVGVARSSTPGNENSKVVAVSSPFLAIGRVIAREGTSTTKVRCWLSAFEFGYFRRENPAGLQPQGVHVAPDADTTLTVAQVASVTQVTMTPTVNPRKLVLPSESLCRGIVLRMNNLAAATHGIQVRDSADANTVVTIPASRAAVVYSDGTTWRAMLGA